ncbi:MAG TPA: DUF4129 domain-containing protein [Verrucomicrobiae bacterium]|nr:DUF4129 domain-containing protein [Verrucomicrobiae bacterium]
MMPSALRRASVVFVLLSGVIRASDRPTISWNQYVEQLQSYQEKLNELSSAPQKAAALRDSIPDEVIVQTSRGDVTVETASLRDGLNHLLTVKPAEKSLILTKLKSRVQSMRQEADSYEQPNRADDATRQRLERILSDKEFDRLREASPFEFLTRIRERVQGWIRRQLSKISPRVPDLGNAGQIFVWVVIGLASAVAGIWLYRTSRQNMMGGKREILPFLPSSRSWQQWLAEAREKGAAGQWRDAVHLGFWAAVSRLESEGVWAPDKARTPREYLNAIPGSSLSREPFLAITRAFEASWYGNRPTAETDFTQFTLQLERLGCR